MADKAGDLGRVLDDMPGLVIKLHIDKDVAWEEFAARDLALTTLAEFLHALDRHHDFTEALTNRTGFVVHLESTDAFFERGFSFVLIARIRMHHIPLFGGGWLDFRARYFCHFRLILSRLRFDLPGSGLGERLSPNCH